MARSDKDKEKDDDDGSSQNADSRSNFGKSWAPSTEYADERTKRHWAQSTDGNQGSPPPASDDPSPYMTDAEKEENARKWAIFSGEQNKAFRKAQEEKKKKAVEIAER